MTTTLPISLMTQDLDPEEHVMGDHAFNPITYARVEITALLPKRCSCCGKDIPAGDTYVALATVCAGEIIAEIDAYHGPMHGSCNAFADWTLD